jgi:hypothetical protein
MTKKIKEFLSKAKPLGGTEVPFAAIHLIPVDLHKNSDPDYHPLTIVGEDIKGGLWMVPNQDIDVVALSGSGVSLADIPTETGCTRLIFIRPIVFNKTRTYAYPDLSQKITNSLAELFDIDLNDDESDDIDDDMPVGKA